MLRSLVGSEMCIRDRLHTTAQFNQVGADGNQVTTPITNEEFNFRWEYVLSLIHI